MSYATITSKGQTTIPKEIREQFNLQPGDRILFFVNDAGRIENPTADRHYLPQGPAKRPKGKVATIEQIREAPRLGAQRRFKRSAP